MKDLAVFVAASLQQHLCDILFTTYKYMWLSIYYYTKGPDAYVHTAPEAYV
jgi:hypothetical protein